VKINEYTYIQIFYSRYSRVIIRKKKKLKSLQTNHPVVLMLNQLNLLIKIEQVEIRKNKIKKDSNLFPFSSFSSYFKFRYESAKEFWFSHEKSPVGASLKLTLFFFN